MPEPDTPGLLVARMAEKHALSTGASREAPGDKCARRQEACVLELDISGLVVARVPEPGYLSQDT